MPNHIGKITPVHIKSSPQISSGQLVQPSFEDSTNSSFPNVSRVSQNSLTVVSSIKTLSPDLDPNAARELCKLESEDEKAIRLAKVEEAKTIAQGLRLEVLRLEALILKYKQRKYTGLQKLRDQKVEELEGVGSSEQTVQELTEVVEILDIKKRKLKFISSDTKHVFGEAFYNTLDYFARRTEIVDKFNDRDLTALVSYYYYKDNLSTLPKGIKNYLPDADIVLAKHGFFDLKGFDNARSLETIEKLGGVINELGLCPVLDGLSPSEVINLISPGCMEGNNPLVREWLIYDNDKWTGEKGKALAKRSMAWVLEHGEKAYDRETGSLDLQKIRDNDWAIAITKRHGLKGMLACCPYVENILEAVRLGLEEIGGKELVDKLPRYFITRGHMWSERGSNGKKLIDDVTDDLISLMRTSHPEMFESVKVVDGKNVGEGNLIASKVRKFNSWTDSYNLLASDCLRGSEMSVYEALKRRCPSVCGWDLDQVKEWELRSRDMWQGDSGKKLFRKAFAYNLGVSGLGKFKVEDGKLSLSFSKVDIDEWFDKVIVSEHKNDLKRFLFSKKLSGGLKYSICKDKVSRALKLLFNVPVSEKLGKPTKSDGSPLNRGLWTREIMKSLLDRSGSVFTVEFGRISEKKIDKKEIDERVSKLINILSTPVQNPFSGGTVTFVRERDLQVERDLILEGSQVGYRYGSFDIKGTRLESLFLDTESSKCKVLARLKAAVSFQGVDCFLKSLSESEFKDLLRILRDDLVDEINLKSDAKPQVKKLINVMLSMKKGLFSVELNSKEIFQSADRLLAYNPSLTERVIKHVEILKRMFDFLGDVSIRLV